MPFWPSSYLFPRCSPPTNCSFIEIPSIEPTNVSFHLTTPCPRRVTIWLAVHETWLVFSGETHQPSSGYTKGPWTETNTPKKASGVFSVRFISVFLVNSRKFGSSAAFPNGSHSLPMLVLRAPWRSRGPWCHALPRDTCWAIVRVDNHTLFWARTHPFSIKWTPQTTTVADDGSGVLAQQIHNIRESQGAPLLSVAHPAPSIENHNPRQFYTMIQNQSQNAVEERATG